MKHRDDYLESNEKVKVLCKGDLSVQGQLTTGLQLQPEESELSPGWLHCQCQRLPKWKSFLSFPVGEWLSRTDLETTLGRGEGDQCLCAPLKDEGYGAQGTVLSPIHAKTIYATWEGQFGIRFWCPDPGLISIGLLLKAITEELPPSDSEEFSGREKSCGRIIH